MKKTILTLVALSAVVSVMGQGVINFSTRVSGTVVGHVYNAGTDGPLSGNTASETPAGATVYSGGLLAGTGFYAQLFVDTGSGFNAVPNSLTTFRTGATLGGTPAPLTLVVPGVAPGTGVGTFIVRAWDNGGNAAQTDYRLALIGGQSDPFTVTGLGDGSLTLPADMANFRSFNITAVPEPATFVLAGLGAAALLIFRRRK